MRKAALASMGLLLIIGVLVAGAGSLSGAGGRILVYPNPFNPKKARGGKLKFEGVPALATVRIYTVTSIRVRELVPPHALAGTCATCVMWDGRNENGVAVAPGIYVWSVEGGGVTERGVLVVE